MKFSVDQSLLGMTIMILKGEFLWGLTPRELMRAGKKNSFYGWAPRLVVQQYDQFSKHIYTITKMDLAWI